MSITSIYSLRQAPESYSFMALYMDGSSDFVYEVGELFDGTPIEDLPEISFSTYPGDPDKPLSDFLNHTTALLFSRKAVEALESILRAHGQLFPVATNVGAYSAYNVTTMVDALDREHSAMDMWPHLKRERQAGIPQGVRGVKEYWFHADRLEGIDIFKLPEFPLGPVYVSDRFVYAVEQAGLVGFSFKRLWSPDDPMPDLRPRRLPG